MIIALEDVKKGETLHHSMEFPVSVACFHLKSVSYDDDLMIYI